MREILFRGKRADNGEWVEGNLFIPDKPETPTQICIGTNVVRITYDIHPETIGQYTGLTDKNGKKIFEGDKVQTMKNFECKWCQDEVCVNAQCPMCTDYCPVPNDPYVCRWEERIESDEQTTRYSG